MKYVYFLANQKYTHKTYIQKKQLVNFKKNHFDSVSAFAWFRNVCEVSYWNFAKFPPAEDKGGRRVNLNDQIQDHLEEHTYRLKRKEPVSGSVLGRSGFSML